LSREASPERAGLSPRLLNANQNVFGAGRFRLLTIDNVPYVVESLMRYVSSLF